MKISVIIPLYNSQEYIERCLLSLEKQTLKDFELLILDDGSKDNSFSLIEEYLQKSSMNIRLYHHENHGVSYTRNRGIQLSKGKYIAFIDNDDYVKEDYLEMLWNAAEDGEYDLVISGYQRANETEVRYVGNVIDSPYTKYKVVAPWARLYRRGFLVGHQIDFLQNPIGEDILFNFKCYVKTNKISYSSYIGYTWYMNTQSVSQTKQKNSLDINHVLDLLEACYEVVQKEIDNYNSYFFYQYIVQHLLFTKEKNPQTIQLLTDWIDSKTLNKKLSMWGSELKVISLKERLVVSLFYMFKKVHCERSFLKLYYLLKG